MPRPRVRRTPTGEINGEINIQRAPPISLWVMDFYDPHPDPSASVVLSSMTSTRRSPVARNSVTLGHNSNMLVCYHSAFGKPIRQLHLVLAIEFRSSTMV